MAEHPRLVKPPGDAPPREAGGLVETETAQDILRSLHVAERLGGARTTMIAGAPGVGKTTAVRRHVERLDRAARMVTAVRGEGGIYPLAEMILSLWGDGTRSRSRTALRQDIVERWRWEPVFLLVDEAQHLDPDALEWLRAAREETGNALALVGDLALERRVRAIPQLWSRMSRPVILKGAQHEDAAALARDAGVTDAAALRALGAVAAHAGGLRSVRAVLDLAALFAGGGVIGPARVKAAIADMKLTPKGARA